MNPSVSAEGVAWLLGIDLTETHDQADERDYDHPPIDEHWSDHYDGTGSRR